MRASVRGSLATSRHTSRAAQLTAQRGRLVVAMAAPLTADVASFKAGLDALQKAPAPHYILFTADTDPATGLPWCGDCIRAVPTVLAAAAKAPGSLLLVTVGPRTAWRDQSHPFRLAPELRLGGIPTLLKWSGGAAVQRLCPELETCASPAEVEKVLASTRFFG